MNYKKRNAALAVFLTALMLNFSGCGTSVNGEETESAIAQEVLVDFNKIDIPQTKSESVSEIKNDTNSEIEEEKEEEISEPEEEQEISLEGQPEYRQELIKNKDNTIQKNVKVTTGSPVDISWFDDCVFLGDSFTNGLGLYNDSFGELGNAQFVCAACIGWVSSQYDMYDPNEFHPLYNGQKVFMYDAPALTGANKVVITLGMNDIGIWGPEGTIEQARSLLYKIRAKSPDLQIYLETVTPMLYGNQKAHLNNQLIRQFNSNLRNFAEQEGCGFLNSYDAFADSNGNLPYDLCSDPGGLGLHFNFKACAIWAEFLKANVGSLDPKPEPESTVSEPVSESSTDTDNTTDTDSEISSENGTVTESAVQEN